MIRIGIVPSNGHTFQDIFAEKNPFFSEHEGRNAMHTAKQRLQEKGIALIDAMDPEVGGNFDLVLYFGNIAVDVLAENKEAVNIYFAYEPPVVDAASGKGNLNLLKHCFDYISDWNDDIVDGKTILKFTPCIDFFHCSNDIAFQNKKLLTSISGNKSSNHPDEIYSERLKVIEYFERHPEEDFEFWGRGWNPSEYGNYRGAVDSKAAVYANYKFAVCFENQKNIGGLVSEKIWDCFLCKIVPIYLGAGNIERYIPPECYIDYREFGSMDNLLNFLKRMTEEEYERYLNSAEALLNSNKKYRFTAEAYADMIADLAGLKKRISVTPAKIFWLKLVKIKIKLQNSIQMRGFAGALKRALKVG